MAALATVMAPAVTYGVYDNVTNAATLQTGGATYRIDRWPTANTNTYPAAWYDNSTTASTIIEMNYIQYQTLDMPYTPITLGTGYTVRVIRNDGNLAYYNYGNNSNWQAYPPLKTPAERLKEILNSRMAPNVISTCRPLGYTTDVREIRARETLHRVLGDDRFKDFVRRGSVSVRAKSGLVYQIFPGHDFTKVYNRGKLVERLCVVLQGGFPPTDSLIMRYLLILNNEAFFRTKAIKHGVSNHPTPIVENDDRSLIEIYKEIKQKFAA